MNGAASVRAYNPGKIHASTSIMSQAAQHPDAAGYQGSATRLASGLTLSAALAARGEDLAKAMQRQEVALHASNSMGISLPARAMRAALISRRAVDSATATTAIIARSSATTRQYACKTRFAPGKIQAECQDRDSAAGKFLNAFPISLFQQMRRFAMQHRTAGGTHNSEGASRLALAPVLHKRPVAESM